VRAIALVALVAVSVVADCSYNFQPSTGPAVLYNLQPMYKSSGDYHGADSAYDYRANICGTSNAGPGCTDHQYSICQYSQAGGAFVASLGSYTIAPAWSIITLPGQLPEDYKNGVQYVMSNGDICFIAGRQQVRTVYNVFRCNPGGTEDGFKIEEDQTSCTFILTFKSKDACVGGGPGPTPSSSGGPGPLPPGPTPVKPSGISGGTVFLIILIVVIPIYIAAGCVFNIKKREKTFGREACPQWEFWSSIPGLAKDGCKFTYYLIKSGCKSGKGEAYEAL